MIDQFAPDKGEGVTGGTLKTALKLSLQALCFIVFSPVLLIMLALVTVCWALDPQERSWLENCDRTFPFLPTLISDDEAETK